MYESGVDKTEGGVETVKPRPPSEDSSDYDDDAPIMTRAVAASVSYNDAPMITRSRSGTPSSCSDSDSDSGGPIIRGATAGCTAPIPEYVPDRVGAGLGGTWAGAAPGRRAAATIAVSTIPNAPIALPSLERPQESDNRTQKRLMHEEQTAAACKPEPAPNPVAEVKVETVAATSAPVSRSEMWQPPSGLTPHQANEFHKDWRTWVCKKSSSGPRYYFNIKTSRSIWEAHWTEFLMSHDLAHLSVHNIPTA